jgi:hypothetical protein
VRRLIVIFVVAAFMASTMVAGVAQAASAQQGPGLQQGNSGPVPGQTVSCSPWEQAWYVSYSGWWYFWWGRWCYNPSIQGGWYVDWASWGWDGYAGPG